MADADKFEIGNGVTYEIPGHAPGEGFGYVIGIPHYSRGYDDVIMVADDKYHGMPINAGHCKAVSCGNAAGHTLRARYERLYPGALKPE